MKPYAIVHKHEWKKMKPKTRKYFVEMCKAALRMKPGELRRATLKIDGKK